MKTLKCTITGVTPLCVHNGQLANPFFSWTKEIKSISSKRKKTDEDFMELARLEWHGSLYLDKDGRYILPGVGLEAAIKDAAKRSKLGKKCNESIQINSANVIQFPKKHLTPEQLWPDENYRLQKMMKVGMSKVLRTVPTFPEWSVEFDIDYFEDEIESRTLQEIVTVCGRINGCFEYRPSHGRFVPESFEDC